MAALVVAGKALGAEDLLRQPLRRDFLGVSPLLLAVSLGDLSLVGKLLQAACTDACVHLLTDHEARAHLLMTCLECMRLDWWPSLARYNVSFMGILRRLTKDVGQCTVLCS